MTAWRTLLNIFNGEVILANDIPLIDLTPLQDGIEGARAIAPQLNEALKNTGFLIFINQHC